MSRGPFAWCALGAALAAYALGRPLAGFLAALAAAAHLALDERERRHGAPIPPLAEEARALDAEAARAVRRLLDELDLPVR